LVEPDGVEPTTSGTWSSSPASVASITRSITAGSAPKALISIVASAP